MNKATKRERALSRRIKEFDFLSEEVCTYPDLKTAAEEWEAHQQNKIQRAAQDIYRTAEKLVTQEQYKKYLAYFEGGTLFQKTNTPKPQHDMTPLGTIKALEDCGTP